MNSVENCEICELIGDINPLVETEHWVGYVKNNQSYLGQSDFLLKRHVGDLALITDEELLDFKKLVNNTEEAMRLAFSADVFNWTCLMNNAYQENPPLPHVHWHLKPRYKSLVEVDGQTFVDEEYGYHYDESKENIVSDELVQQISDRISDKFTG